MNFASQIIQCAKLLKKMNLTAEEWIVKNVFPKDPFYRDKGRRYAILENC